MASQICGFIRTVGLCLFLATSAFAEPVKSENVPPVENASFHQLVFADEDVAVLNNVYPPGGDSGFHAHFRDMFYVVIQPGDASVQNVGQPLTAAAKVAAGTAAYGALGGQPRIHRVVNGDQGTAQIIVVELRRSKPAGQEISSREANRYTQIVDNPRIRAWRLVLKPGEETSSMTQGGKGIRVVVRGGLLTTTTPGVPDQVLALRPGDFAVQPAGVRRALKNTGTETIELVELELK